MGVEIHAQSIVLFAAGSVAVALILCGLLRRHTQSDAATKWLMASNVTLLVVIMGVFLRLVIGVEPSALVVITGAYVGLSFGFFAILSALGRNLPVHLVGAIGMIGFLIHQTTVFLASGYIVLLISTSVLSTVLATYMMVSVWQAGRDYGQRIAILLCLPFGIMLSAFFARIVVLGIWADTSGAMAATLMIVVGMAWAAVVLELAMITLSEMKARLGLKAALVRLEDAEAARTRFLLGISHELRTPLNAILGLSEVMRMQLGGPLPGGYAEHADRIHDSGKDLMELITDLLDHAESYGEDRARVDPDEMNAAIDARLINADATRPGKAA